MGKNELYYSNHCQHCMRLLGLIRDNGLIETFSFICVDNRGIDPRTQLPVAILSNGQAVKIPINVTRVPSLLLTNEKYIVVYGCDAIISRYVKTIDANTTVATQGQGEPLPAGSGSIGGSSIGGSSIGGSSTLTGVSVNTVPTLSPMVSTSNNGARLKEGDIDLKELEARRQSEVNIEYSHN
jgi:hypothetical protein